MITAAVVRQGFLDPAMDARALNVEQRALIANATPDADCLFDFLTLLRGQVPTRQLVPIAQLSRRLGESNQREGTYERHIAGAADRLFRDVRDSELNRTGEAVLTSKAIARAVREPLAALLAAEAVDSGALRALRAVDQVVRQAPRLQVLSSTVEHELGVAKFSLLRDLVDRDG